MRVGRAAELEAEDGELEGPVQHAMDTEDELERSVRPAEEGGTELEAEAKEGELEEGGTELEEGELVEEGELAGQRSWRPRRES